MYLQSNTYGKKSNHQVNLNVTTPDESDVTVMYQYSGSVQNGSGNCQLDCSVSAYQEYNADLSVVCFKNVDPNVPGLTFAAWEDTNGWNQDPNYSKFYSEVTALQGDPEYSCIDFTAQKDNLASQAAIYVTAAGSNMTANFIEIGLIDPQADDDNWQVEENMLGGAGTLYYACTLYHCDIVKQPEPELEPARNLRGALN